MARLVARADKLSRVTSNPRVPPLSASVTRTSYTCAYSGPLRHHSSSASTSAAAPSKCPATDPSGSLATQPATPRRAACSWVRARKNTPCTRPVITTSTALRLMTP